MVQVVQISGAAGGECSVLLSGQDAVLIDTGYAFSAEKMAAQLKQVLGGRSLSRILLTHSHYDHVGGCRVLKRHFPDAVLTASEAVQKILRKPTAMEVMKRLDASAAQENGMHEFNGWEDGIDIDHVVQDGDRIAWGSESILILSTPGHTRCSTSFYFEQEGLLAAAETVGIAPFFPKVSPAFITGYRDTLDSIAKCAALAPKSILLSHSPLIAGADAGRFWDYAKQAAEDVFHFVRQGHEQGLPAEEIIEQYRARWYPALFADVQPEIAFMMNAEAMVPRLLKEIEQMDTPEKREGDQADVPS